MTKIIRIERLIFCCGDERSTLRKGAGWVVRTSDLRISDTADQISHLSRRGHRDVTLTIFPGLRTLIEREYRMLRRKGVVSAYQRVVAALSQSFRSRLGC